MSHEERFEWMAGVKGGGTVSPMYMSALAHAAGRGKLTLRQSVKPCVIAPEATAAMVAAQDSHDGHGGQVDQDEQQPLTLRPLRVAFEPSVATGNCKVGAAAAQAMAGVAAAQHIAATNAAATDDDGELCRSLFSVRLPAAMGRRMRLRPTAATAAAVRWGNSTGCCSAPGPNPTAGRCH